MYAHRSQVYAAKKDNQPSKIVKLKLWLETAGLCLNAPVTKILRLKQHESLSIWQLEVYDELISLNVPICKLLEKNIEIVCELVTLNDVEAVRGSLRLFTESGVMKSGLKSLLIGSEVENRNLFELEERLYRRKLKQVPAWHVQLMKDRLEELKEEFCTEGLFVVNLIIPTPSHPLKLEKGSFKNDASNVDICIRDVMESQEDSMFRRKYPKLFSSLTTSTLSNGDLRALNGILHRGFEEGEGVPVDAANLIWNHREYLARRVPRAIVHFVQSVQWWLSASDPLEVDEALRVIDSWQFPEDEGDKMEIGMMLMVGMCGVNGLSDSEVWLNLFTRLICATTAEDATCTFSRKYQSALIMFLTRRETEGMIQLRDYLKKRVLFNEKDASRASELYWRLKTLDDQKLFEEYKEIVGEEMMAEFRKQERLFEAIEGVLTAAQKVKGSRGVKLEALKRGLSDPEMGVLSACQQQAILPGLQAKNEEDRIMAVVSDRSNLFKSTAFTVLLLFLRQNASSLPIIFKKGDDLRKDAACLRVFRAIWDIWREEGGLELFERRLLYGVTAFTKEFGMVEYVESVPMSGVLKAEEGESYSEWAVTKYLQSLGDPSRATSNFLSSCVGFSLLTYLLGIGDRHLDNLLVTPEGQLFHIDFSFLFGEDPKPFAPPIKITREMVRGFEGASVSRTGVSRTGLVDARVGARAYTAPDTTAYTAPDIEKWSEFKGLCFTALSLLRHKSPSILSTLQSEYHSNNTTREYVKFVRDRLKVVVSQAEGLRELERLMEESRVAMFPVVLEAIHKWAQYWKS